MVVMVFLCVCGDEGGVGGRKAVVACSTTASIKSPRRPIKTVVELSRLFTQKAIQSPGG